jgi:hypothetical protein
VHAETSKHGINSRVGCHLRHACTRLMPVRVGEGRKTSKSDRRIICRQTKQYHQNKQCSMRIIPAIMYHASERGCMPLGNCTEDVQTQGRRGLEAHALRLFGPIRAHTTEPLQPINENKLTKLRCRSDKLNLISEMRASKVRRARPKWCHPWHPWM